MRRTVKKTARKPKRKLGTAQDGILMHVQHPPQIQNYGIGHSTKLRFTSIAAANQFLVTYQNLMDLLNVALTTVTAAQLFRSVRVRKVSVWAVPVIGNPSTVEVVFISGTVGQAGDLKIHTDTSMGVQPAYVSAKPAVRSAAALFQESSATNAFSLTCPAGSVIDVDLTFRGLPNSFLPTQNAPAGVTAGGWYYRGLDGLAKAATNFLPAVESGSID